MKDIQWPMRKIVLATVLGSAALAAGLVACSQVNAGSAGSDASVEGEDAARSDSATPPLAVPDASSEVDSSSFDAGTAIGDGSREAADGSSNNNDAGDGSDAGDADDGASVVDASDAGDGAGNCVPPLGNVAFCGTASATSTYSSTFAPSAINDGDLNSSWYAATGACAAGVCAGDSLRVDVVLDAARTIGRVKIFGNRDYLTGFDVLTARIDLLDGLGAVVTTAAVTTTRGNEPNGDVDYVVSPAATSVKTVRVVVVTGESSGPGMAEIQAFAN